MVTKAHKQDSTKYIIYTHHQEKQHSPIRLDLYNLRPIHTSQPQDFPLLGGTLIIA